MLEVSAGKAHILAITDGEATGDGAHASIGADDQMECIDGVATVDSSEGIGIVASDTIGITTPSDARGGTGRGVAMEHGKNLYLHTHHAVAAADGNIPETMLIHARGADIGPIP